MGLLRWKKTPHGGKHLELSGGIFTTVNLGVNVVTSAMFTKPPATFRLPSGYESGYIQLRKGNGVNVVTSAIFTKSPGTFSYESGYLQLRKGKTRIVCPVLRLLVQLR